MTEKQKAAEAWLDSLICNLTPTNYIVEHASIIKAMLTKTNADGDTRGEANKIDWTKPLRVVGTHERVTTVQIENDTCWFATAYFRREGGTLRALVNLNGVAVCGNASVENIPPEPRIVERWAIVERTPSGYRLYDQYSCTSRESVQQVRGTAKIAKLLIEETDA